MKKIIILIILFAMTHSVIGNNDKYQDYYSQMKEKQGVILSIPEKLVRFHTDVPMMIFTFGKMIEDLPTLPMFKGKVSVNLSEHCIVIMEDISHRSKPHSYPSSQHRIHDMPDVTGWMLNNCNAPWAKWYIENMGGVISNNSKSLSKEEQDSLKEKVLALRSRYERYIEDTKLTQKANCDKIFIVRIPNIEKIAINEFEPNSLSSAIDTELKKNMTKCYGVEFFKQSSYTNVKMLFFINGENTTIEKCIAEVADYLKFE